jgi:hypothetical protein
MDYDILAADDLFSRSFGETSLKWKKGGYTQNI